MMTRFIVRRRAARGIGPITPSLLGLGLGTIVGFLLGELVGPTAARAIGQSSKGPQRSMAELVHDAQAALDASVELAGLALEVLPVSRQKLELHGWVADRKLRTLAHRVVREAIGDDRVVNCILVHGEDDTNPPTLDVLSA